MQSVPFSWCPDTRFEEHRRPIETHQHPSQSVGLTERCCNDRFFNNEHKLNTIENRVLDLDTGRFHRTHSRPSCRNHVSFRIKTLHIQHTSSHDNKRARDLLSGCTSRSNTSHWGPDQSNPAVISQGPP